MRFRSRLFRPRDHLRPVALRQKEVPAYLREQYGLTYSVWDLWFLAKKGDGPPRAALSKRAVLYPLDALDAWAKARLRARA